MFGFLLGWRKASKCNIAVKQLQCRLKLLKNKKYAISSHLRHDVAQLLRIGERNRALRRAHHLFLDEYLMSLYHLLLHFSDFILLHKELSDGIDEAVSTLVFASARCGDLPELRTLRLLFGERYGQPFVATALHLLPGNRVNPQAIEKLSIKSVPDDAKSKLLAEITEEFGLRLQVLELEYTPGFDKQVIDSREPEEEREVMGFDVTSAPPCPSQDAHSEAELYKFTLRDVGVKEKQEESRSKASTDQRKAFDEDDCIGEEVVEKDQRVFRFRETKDERKRSRRRSRSASSSPIAEDVECWKYCYKGRRRRQKEDQCYHIVYNVFSMWPDQNEKGEVERGLKEAKHVHPKLPYYDQIAAHFTALRNNNVKS
ncbi:unnamed protein product [Thlaspi arvense]|uniref:Uncharacterized protein n=1 Tax=Thlaspi arvense TaxID=13288 RepID=A0AAU9RUU7_THLAR|nr:unnamed protein product [Thlaspi arvense]